MRIVFSSRFTKRYKKLAHEQQVDVDAAITRFQTDPFHPRLRNHGLKGELKGLRAIKAGYDLRILYQEEKGHVVVCFLDVGTHDQVY